MIIDIERYTARILSATPLQLLIINYEIAIDYVNGCIVSAENNDEISFKSCIDKSVKSIEALMNSLDMKHKLSNNLMALYIYTNKLLNSSRSNYNKSNLQEVKQILVSLLDSWYQLEENDTSSTPVLQTSQKLYAGLTYKNGELEEYVEESGNEYKA